VIRRLIEFGSERERIRDKMSGRPIFWYSWGGEEICLQILVEL